MDFSNLLNHPDVDEIVGKLLSGTAGKSIYDWLQLKYPNQDQAHLRLSSKLLTEFQNSDYLNYYKQIEKDLVKVQNNQPLDPKIAASLLNKKTYRERLNEALDKKIEAEEAFKQMHVVFMTRVEQIFDKIQEDPGMVRKDTEGSLLKYLELWMGFVEKHERLINNKPDQVIQHNHIVSYYDQYTHAMQEAIMEVCREVDDKLAFLFMEKLSSKTSGMIMPNLPEATSVMTEKKLLQEAKMLQQKINGDI